MCPNNTCSLCFHHVLESSSVPWDAIGDRKQQKRFFFLLYLWHLEDCGVEHCKSISGVSSTRLPEIVSDLTSKQPFKKHRPHGPESRVLWIGLSEQRGLPCGLFTAAAGFMIEQKQTRRTVLCFLYSCFYCHSNPHRGNVIFPSISHPFNRFQFSF